MGYYLSKRVFTLIISFIGVSFIVFIILHVIAPEPARLIAGPQASIETVQSIRAELGLDRPLHEQYINYFIRLVQGDFGRSWRLRVPVLNEIMSRLPATLYLMFAAMVIQTMVGLILGAVSAIKSGKLADRIISMVLFVSLSAPVFWIALVLLYVFAFQIRIFPLGGYGTVMHIMLPAITVAIVNIPWYARVFRASLLDVMSEDYLRTARAKGLTEWAVLYRHTARNAMRPVVTLLGLGFAELFGTILVVEMVFGWPGVGALLLDAVRNMDVPMVMGTVLLSAFFVLIASIFTDIAYSYLDPRVRL